MSDTWPGDVLSQPTALTWAGPDTEMTTSHKNVLLLPARNIKSRDLYYLLIIPPVLSALDRDQIPQVKWLVELTEAISP